MSNNRNNIQSSEQRKGHWMYTSTGGKYWPLDPRMEEVNIYDIAHHLSLLCRFTGACDRFYSVAEHSILVSEYVPKEHALSGLLHDATEAYLGDVGSPLKKSLPEYRSVEDRNWVAVAERFNLPYEMHPSIKEADIAVLIAECGQLGIHTVDSTVVPDKPPSRYVHIRGLNPLTAEELFLVKFQDLTGWTLQ